MKPFRHAAALLLALAPLYAAALPDRSAAGPLTPRSFAEIESFAGPVRQRIIVCEQVDRATRSSWFDAEGRIVADRFELAHGPKKLHVDTLFYDEEGRPIELRAYDYERNGVPCSDTLVRRCTQTAFTPELRRQQHYLGTYDIPRSAAFDTADSLCDARGNWLYGYEPCNERPFIRRRFRYEGALTAAERREAERIERLAAEVRTAVAAERQAQEEEGALMRTVSSIVLAVMGGGLLLVFVLLFLKIRKPLPRSLLQGIAAWLLLPTLAEQIEALHAVKGGVGALGTLGLMLLGAAAVVWYTRRQPAIEQRMIYDRSFPNGYIWLWHVLMHTLVAFVLVWPVAAAVTDSAAAGYLVAGGVWLWSLLGRTMPLYWRCSRCHAYDNVHFNGRFKDGVRSEHDHETHNEEEHSSAGDSLRYRETTTRIHRIRYYRMYRDEYTCGECGHHWKHRFTGELVGSEKRTTTETEEGELR